MGRRFAFGVRRDASTSHNDAGRYASAEPFAKAWSDLTGTTINEVMAGRLYRLATLESPVVPGTPRLGKTEEDIELHVATANDLNMKWLARFETIGLTAGTSTLDATLDEVHKALTCVTPRSAPKYPWPSLARAGVANTVVASAAATTALRIKISPF